MLRIGKSAKERAEVEQMREAVARYDGPITRCPPGVARGHETVTPQDPNRANRASNAGGPAARAALDSIPNPECRATP